MVDLNAPFRPWSCDAPGGSQDPGQTSLGRVVVKPKAAMADSAAALCCRGFKNDEAGPGNRQLHQVHQMPIAGATIISAVLAHRRDHDAIWEPDRPDVDG